MPKGMQPIFTRNLSGANSATFINIPQTYTDLKLVVSARAASGTDTAQGIYMQLNGDPSLVYSGVTLRNASNSANAYRSNGSNAFLEFDINSSNNTANNYTSVEIYIPNYTSNTFKQVIAETAKEDNSSSSFTYNIIRANLYKSNAPITSFQIGTNISAPNFAAHSTATLYGISK